MIRPYSELAKLEKLASRSEYDWNLWYLFRENMPRLEENYEILKKIAYEITEVSR